MITASDILTVIVIAGVAGTCGASTGIVALRLLRHRSMLAAMRVVALTSALVVAVSVVATAAIMLVTGHALAVLVAAAAASAAAGLLVANLLGRRIAQGSAELRTAIRRVGADQAPGELGSSSPGELAALSEELARAHERLAQARDRERALEASRRELITWISHDLRTPLAGIRAMAEALEDGVVNDPPGVAEYHKGLRVESDRLARMVEELFELSRLQAGAMQFQPEVIDLRAIAEDAIASAVPVARSREIEVALEVASPAPVLADRRHCARATGNLLFNAVRHSPDAGRVTVVVGSDSTLSYLSVSDECGGIAPEHLPRIFDVGYRAEQARTPAHETGAGLGLAITRGIVEANGGTTGVVNHETGCRFTVLLPAATHQSLDRAEPAKNRIG